LKGLAIGYPAKIDCGKESKAQSLLGRHGGELCLTQGGSLGSKTKVIKQRQSVGRGLSSGEWGGKGGKSTGQKVVGGKTAYQKGARVGCPKTP